MIQLFLFILQSRSLFVPARSVFFFTFFAETINIKNCVPSWYFFILFLQRLNIHKKSVPTFCHLFYHSNANLVQGLLFYDSTESQKDAIKWQTSLTSSLWHYLEVSSFGMREGQKVKIFFVEIRAKIILLIHWKQEAFVTKCIVGVIGKRGQLPHSSNYFYLKLKNYFYKFL
jgi:hypothetical protein